MNRSAIKVGLWWFSFFADSRFHGVGEGDWFLKVMNRTNRRSRRGAELPYSDHGGRVGETAETAPLWRLWIIKGSWKGMFSDG